MSNKNQPQQADRTTIVLLGLAAEVPLLFCPLMIWRGSSWAPPWWVDAALYTAAAVTAVGVLAAARRPATVRGARQASVLIGGATCLTAVGAATVFFGGSDGTSSSWLLLGGVVTLVAVHRHVTRTAPPRS